MGCINAINVLVLSATVATSLARNADSGLTFREYYEDSTNTYGTLNLDGYILPRNLPRTTTPLMVVREGVPVNIELDPTKEADRQIHATACANACSVREECFGFLVAFHELADKECQLLTIGNMYKLAGEYYDYKDYTTAHMADNYKQVYFTEKSPCPEGGHILYEADGDEVSELLDLGCRELVQEGDACEKYLHTFNNAHGEHPCTEGTECVNLVDMNYNPETWSQFEKFCIPSEDVAAVEPQKTVREERMERVRSDTANGAYDELEAGVYTVPNYKTLRSKFGDTLFTVGHVPFIPEELTPVPSLSGANEYPTADAFAWECGEICDTETECTGFSIIWQPDTAEWNECYLFSGLVSLSMYSHQKNLDYFVFLGQAFVPKSYTRCPEDDQVLLFALRSYSFKSLGCRMEYSPLISDHCYYTYYDATNDKYAECS